MNCEEARRHWDLYHDSEGDAALHFQINEHLASCRECAEWFAQQSRFENLLGRHLSLKRADAPLWRTVLENAAGVKPGSPRKLFRPALLAACLLTIVMLSISVWLGWFRAGEGSQPSLSANAAGFHARLTSGQDVVGIHSRSDLEVEDYLRQQVSFPVRCPPRKDAGFAVAGAGTCSLAGEPAAYLVGSVDQSPVSIFVLASESISAFPHQAAALRQKPVHRCREGDYEMALGVIDRNLVLVIGQTSGDQLLRVLRAYGTYPHPNSG